MRICGRQRPTKEYGDIAVIELPVNEAHAVTTAPQDLGKKLALIDRVARTVCRCSVGAPQCPGIRLEAHAFGYGPEQAR